MYEKNNVVLYTMEIIRCATVHYICKKKSPRVARGYPMYNFKVFFAVNQSAS